MNEIDLVINVLGACFAEGSPICSWEPEQRREMAEIAIRRWRSAEQRLGKRNSRAARVLDLAKGLSEKYEKSPVGPLMRDYEFVAERIVNALEPPHA